MITKTVRGGNDTYAGSAQPARTHAGSTYLTLKSGAALAYLLLASPVPRGAVVISAKLQVRAYGGSSGSRTLTVRRIAKRWTASKLTWNNRPGVTGVARTKAIGTVSSGALIEFDVTSHVQSVANGSPHYGWRIETNASTAHKLYAINAGKNVPTLVVQYAFQPSAPTGLTDGVVSIAKPLLQFDFNSHSGQVDIAAIQVQVGGFDSGEVVTTQPEFDLADSLFTGLAVGTTTWRARFKTADGFWSPWSAYASLTLVTKAALSIIVPGAVAPADVVNEPTPTIEWSLAGQQAYQVRIAPAANRNVLLYDSGKLGGADSSFTLPPGVLSTPGVRYAGNVRGWDNQPRVASPGDPIYSEGWTDFTFEYNASGPTAGSLVVTRPTGAPRVRLEFTCTVPVDTFTIERDGVVIAAGLDPDDLLISGSDYSYDDWAATPFTSHTWRVVPISGGVGAPGGPVATGKFRTPGAWIVDPQNGAYFNLLEVSPNLSYGEDAEVTPTFSFASRKIGSMRGLEGSLTGVLVDETEFDPRPFAAQLVDLYDIKGRATATYRFLYADMNIPVLVGELSPAPSSDFLEGIEQRAVSVSIWQQGELPFVPQA